jgi:hypothetical protein
MKTSRHLALVAFVLSVSSALSVVLTAQPALTIYNQSFAVVRDRVPLELKAGVNAIAFAGVTAQMETDSVVLRDPAGKNALRVLRQSYRADTISTGLMLQLNEGKTITFLVRDKDQKEFPVKGKIIRSGYNPGAPRGLGGGNGGNDQSPIIEVDGQLRFSLPGEPIFPALADDAILKPTLSWEIDSPAAAKFEAELGYVTGGFSWQAAYNLVAPEKGDKADLVGWVTISNTSGKTFENATVKLMAGDVNNIQPVARAVGGGGRGGGAGGFGGAAPVVTEKAVDEFHLYSLARPATVHDRETVQVEFVRAEGITAPALYIYDGAAVGNYRGISPDAARQPNYGTQSNTKVSVMREFKNTKENGLGLPLPKGRVRFYRQDDADHRIEFTGENNLDHTPKDETVRLYVGDSFDLVGERKRTDYNGSASAGAADETFEIKVRNHKAEPAEIRVVEHLYRSLNWAITEKTDNFTKTDAQTIEFRVMLAPDEQKTVTYKVHYTWN